MTEATPYSSTRSELVIDVVPVNDAGSLYDLREIRLEPWICRCVRDFPKVGFQRVRIQHLLVDRPGYETHADALALRSRCRQRAFQVSKDGSQHPSSVICDSGMRRK